MRETLLETAAEVVPQVLYAVGAGLLTIAGAFAEYNSVRNAVAGEAVLTVWFAVVGSVLLYAGVYQLGYRTLARPAGGGD